ncbi:MAG: NADH-quinone oxidoreductase subunit M [Phycisphaerales bacterium]|nr:NADH-quinone oxidoreductase subunit M [Phycisphaerales bacterium]MCB9856164.1 NADH-quinone oxidoreductase subunit M [Phycisphaerales bacterium]
MDASLVLNLVIFGPLLGMVLVLIAPAEMAKRITWLTSFVVFLLSLTLFPTFLDGSAFDGGYGENMQAVTQMDWINVVGLKIQYHIGLDGLSFALIILTTLVMWLAAWTSWNFNTWKVNKGAKGYFALFLLLETGILGTFASIDFFLFYIFWELMLLPMYFLIGVWGGAKKEYAAIKFFIYTLAGSVLMLVALLAMYYSSADAMNTSTGTFDLITYATNKAIQQNFNDPNHMFLGWNFGKVMFIFLFIGFMIKVPLFPFHTWLPLAHVEAPTPISMILAGVLLKLGAYGFLRVCYPIFPAAATELAFLVATLGVVNIIYGAFCCLAQTDFKRLVAYSSISHMGYVVLGIAVMTTTGFQGAMFQILAHGISSPMCFFLVGVIYDRAHHREINRFGGLWLQMPKYGSLATLGFFASLGLPGLCGFIGEAWVLLGTFNANKVHESMTWAPGMAVVAAFGVVLTAAYILWMIQRVYLGTERKEYAGFPDVTAREAAILVPFAVLAIFMGVMPGYTFQLMNGTIDQVLTLIKPMTAMAFGG